MDDNKEVEILIEEKIILANELANKLQTDFNKVDGAIKTKRCIDKEMKFLKRLKTNFVDDEGVTRKLQCTNLNFYNHLVNSLCKYQEYHTVTSIAKNQKRNSDDKNIRIDIVCCDNNNNEVLWIKIIARNSESIMDCVNGRTEYGSKDILEVADNFIELAEDSELNFFRPPKVIFDFLNPIDEILENALEEKGITIGRKYRENLALNKNVRMQQVSRMFMTLNVDVSTMLAYISELANGGENYIFKERLLNEQAAVERKDPIKPVLDKIFEGKRLIACDSAVKSFEEIVQLLGGQNEKQRAQEFKKRIEIFPDVEFPEEIINIELSSHIKERSRRIFAFGIYHEAITVSSNRGFIRAAKMNKNFDIPMIAHSARALTENKQCEMIK